jgi:hypothetical protein
LHTKINENILYDGSIYKRLKGDFFEVYNDGTNVAKETLQKFQPFLDAFQSIVGKTLLPDELPITREFMDFSKPHLYETDGKYFLTIKEKGPNLGSAGGRSMKILCEIAELEMIGSF